MIITEFFRIREDGADLYRTYSDQGMMLLHESGALYEEAVNTQDALGVFTETDIPIPSEEITDSEALAILLGEEADA